MHGQRHPFVSRSVRGGAIKPDVKETLKEFVDHVKRKARARFAPMGLAQLEGSGIGYSEALANARARDAHQMHILPVPDMKGEGKILDRRRINQRASAFMKGGAANLAGQIGEGRDKGMRKLTKEMKDMAVMRIRERGAAGIRGSGVPGGLGSTGAEPIGKHHLQYPDILRNSLTEVQFRKNAPIVGGGRADGMPMRLPASAMHAPRLNPNRPFVARTLIQDRFSPM